MFCCWRRCRHLFSPPSRPLLGNPPHNPRRTRTRLSRKRRIRHPRTIVTIAGIATSGVTATVTILRPNTSSKVSGQKAKGGAKRLPLFANLLCRLRSALEARMFRERRAPQKRCDQLWCSSKPGGVIIPPELSELTPSLYSFGSLDASGEFVNLRFTQNLLKPDDCRRWFT
jgi:hypothetical protein